MDLLQKDGDEDIKVDPLLVFLEFFMVDKGLLVGKMRQDWRMLKPKLP